MTTIGSSLAYELPDFDKASGVFAVVAFVGLAPLVDCIDVLGLECLLASMAFGFVLWCSHASIVSHDYMITQRKDPDPLLWIRASRTTTHYSEAR